MNLAREEWLVAMDAAERHEAFLYDMKLWRSAAVISSFIQKFKDVEPRNPPGWNTADDPEPIDRKEQAEFMDQQKVKATLPVQNDEF